MTDVLPFNPGAATLVDGDPTGVFAPAIVGHIAVDPSTGDAYVGIGTTAADWKPTGGGGGSQPVRPLYFDFAFDTPGLTDGLVAYTPAEDEELLNAWMVVLTAWDGETPSGDFGTFVGTTSGLFGDNDAPLDMTNIDAEHSGAGYRYGFAQSEVGTDLHLLGASGVQGGDGPLFRVAPGTFTATNPLKVVVSQDGTIGGDDPGSSQGIARLKFLIATFAPSPG